MIRTVLRLRNAISKRKLRVQQGYTAQQFENVYANALQVDARAAEYARFLIIDDVCTEGSTLRCAIWALRSVVPKAQIVAATAGQMIVKAVLRDETGMLN